MGKKGGKKKTASIPPPGSELSCYDSFEHGDLGLFALLAADDDVVLDEPGRYVLQAAAAGRAVGGRLARVASHPPVDTPPGRRAARLDDLVVVDDVAVAGAVAEAVVDLVVHRVAIVAQRV